MKRGFTPQKTVKTTTLSAGPNATSGPKGIAVVPPAYGVDVIDSQVIQAQQPPVPENNTGLPDTLKTGIETLSGLSMDDVKVHYNSVKPSQLEALAYTQGTDIHVGPDQERHLPHEAWHVVQQKQGRVKPKMQIKGAAINNDTGLEKEAVVMGSRSMQFIRGANPVPGNGMQKEMSSRSMPAQQVIQRADVHTVGDNKYHTETFDTNRERPNKVEAKIHQTNTSGRGSAPTAIALYNPTTRTYDPLLGYDGGHVLGLELGGADKKYNVVPMLPKFNRNTWRKVEERLIGDANFIYSGKNFHIEITLAYADDTAKIPDSLTVKGYADIPKTRKNRSGKSVPTGKVEKNKKVVDITKSQPDDIEITPAPTAGESQVFLGTNPTATKVLSELAKRKDFSTSDFLRYIRTNRHLPVSDAQDYPDKPADRPNEYLDILTLSGQIYSDANFVPRKEFSSVQRQNILKYNMANNGGILQSDDPNDPHQILDERGAANFPEVDHIIPKSQGGSNFYSNARLVSWQLNNKEDRVKDITPFIGLDRISYPALTGREDQADLLAKGKLVLKKWLGEAGLDNFNRTDAIVAMKNNTTLADKKAKDLAVDVLGQLVTEDFLDQAGRDYTVK